MIGPRKSIFAYTEPSSLLPGYFSVSEQEGVVVLTTRSPGSMTTSEVVVPEHVLRALAQKIIDRADVPVLDTSMGDLR